MTEKELELIKGIHARVNALEKTILASPLAEEYKTNLIFWKNELDSRIEEARLKAVSSDSHADLIPPEQ
jgi:hypothetical protein